MGGKFIFIRVTEAAIPWRNTWDSCATPFQLFSRPGIQPVVIGTSSLKAVCCVPPLMIGAMIESRLATSAAAHFVAGLGGFRYIDLDNPMLLADDPFTGGYEQRGGVYDVSDVERGLGVVRK